MNPTYDFTGQVALVTGGSSGMGLATVRAFAEAGAAVVIADINQTTLDSAADEVTAAGHRVLGVRCDVSDEDSVAAMVKATVDTFGRLDMAYNNAGIQVPPSDAADEPAEVFDRVNAINLRGAAPAPATSSASPSPSTAATPPNDSGNDEKRPRGGHLARLDSRV
jgi:NAD(P)-dependent dehydrogenase (short-subunit alcohol dehydrogenase family)